MNSYSETPGFRCAAAGLRSLTYRVDKCRLMERTRRRPSV